MPIGKPENKCLPLLLAGLLTGLSAQPSVAQESLPVYTGEWPPYVRADASGNAARIVRLVLHDAGIQADFRFFDFAYVYYLSKTGRAPLAFPFFRTGAREAEVVFSAPLFSVSNRIFYNRRFNSFASGQVDFAQLRFGSVAGYSYGEAIDSISREPVVFASEVEAIEALLSNAIDVLPITDSVADTILREQFPNRSQLILPLPDFVSTSTLHVIAPDNPEGRALIERFNQSHARLLAEDIIADTDQSALTAFSGSVDIAQIIASEGFPIVVGVDRQDRGRHFAIPQGTRVIVLEWSEKIRDPASDDRLYQTMVDESLVVVLNGPHVGKELFVKNMHIAIIE